MLTIGEIFSRLLIVGVDILSSTLDASTNTITAQLGDVTKDDADSDSAELWFGSPGHIGRPALPTQGKASCQGTGLKRGDHDIILGYRDLRCSSIYGKLAPGETATFATTGQARTLYKKDGSITDVTTSDNTSSGTTITHRIGPDGWTVTTPWGQISITSSGFMLTVGTASLKVTPALIEALAQQIDAQGEVASFLGQTGTFIGTNATPNPAQAAAMGPTGPVNIVSSNVYIGGLPA